MEFRRLLVVLTIAVAADVILGARCPGGCTCEGGNREVKCHLPAAKSIPQNLFLRNVTKLDLSGNNVLNIPAGSMRSLPTLQELHLDHNKLYFMENGAFKGANELTSVYLEDNNIRFIENDVFSSLENLNQLNLMRNQLTKFPNVRGNSQLNVLSLSYNKIAVVPSGALKENEMLQELHMKSNELSELPRDVFPEDVANFTALNLVKNRLRYTPDVVKEMIGLENLFLCYNPIKIFHSEDFRPLIALKKLTLTDVGLKEFPENVFWLPKLEYLDVGKNKIGGNSLQHIRFPSLTTLVLKNNPIGVIGSASFIAIPNLENLIVSSCEISVIHERAFMSLLHLKKLDLRDNKLSSLPVLQENRELEEIILDNNNIQAVDLGNFKTLTSLKSLSLVNNSLSQLTAPMSSFSLSLTSINLSGNKFARIPPPEILKLMPSLTSLDLSRNSLSDELSISSISNLENLETLNVKGNSLTSLLSDNDEPLSLRNLYLCGNNLTTLENGSLANFPNLTELTVDRNEIVFLTSFTFSENPFLKKLSLVSNNLQNIDGMTFKSLSELSELRLNYNDLQRPPNISMNRKLAVLGLCNNPIGNLQPGALAGPKALEVVLLRSMGLTSLEANVFANIRAIRHLNLALDNEFTSVPPVIRNMTSLRILKLTGNPISHFSARDFEGLNNLREIRLDNMQVKSTDITEIFPTLPALRSLRLSGNPWQCDCNMQWYALGMDGARARISTEDYSMLRCAGPARLRGKPFEYLRLGDFMHCGKSNILEIGETSALISLPHISGLSPHDGVLNRISYISLPGREESVIVADRHKKRYRLLGLIPDTTYLVCVATVKSSPVANEGANTPSNNKIYPLPAFPATERDILSSESCRKFKTLSLSVETPWAKGGLGSSTERSHYLLIIYAVLGGTLGVAVLMSTAATVFWCRKRRRHFSKASLDFENSSNANGLNGGGEIDAAVSNAPPRGGRRNKRKANKEEENGEVLEMGRDANAGHDNLGCDVTNVAQRTKL